MPKSSVAPPLILLLFSAVCGGAETTTALNPRRPPIAVLRLPKPEAAEAVSASGPGRIFGLAGRDWDARLPGLSRMTGIRAFLARLGDAGAEDVWFCLAELNRSALGWRWRPPANNPETAGAAAKTLLLDSGFDIARGVVVSDPLGDGRHQVVFAPDGKFLSDLRGDDPVRERGWRAGLAAFMERQETGIGLWLNPRPLSGLAAVATGFDLRSLSASAGFGMDFPSAVTAWIVPRGAALGVHFRADDFAPPDLTVAHPPAASAAAAGAAFPGPPLFRLDFQLSGLHDLAAKAFPPVPPGVEWRKLLPGAASFGLWRGDDGGMEWAVVGDVADGEGALRTFRRMADWLLAFLSGPGGGATVSPLAGDETVCALSLGAGSAHAAAGVKRIGAAKALIFLANVNPERLPGFPEIPARPAALPGPPEMKWDLRLDSEALETLTRELTLTASWARHLDPEAWRSVIGGEEAGRLALDDGGLSLDSPRGALIWMLPAAGLYAGRIRESIRPDPPALAVARLRFLLRAAGLSRFRAAEPDGLTPEALPSSLRSLAFSDPDGMAWLENALPGFPGLDGLNGRALSLLAGGGRIDGYGYAIETASGWHIAAKPADADWPALRIDRDGFVTESRGGGGWMPRRETLADWIAGMAAFQAWD